MVTGERRARGTFALCLTLGLSLHWTLLCGQNQATAWSQAPKNMMSTKRKLRATGDEISQEKPHQRFPPPKAGFAWKDLGFGLTTTDTQVSIATCPKGGEWSSVRLQPYGPLLLDPAATILNYGQGLFEGMKAFRTTKGRIVLFRPAMNAQRMAAGAERLLMPPVPESFFLEAVAKVVMANAEWVPPAGEGDLYLRPLLIGSGGSLGVGPSPEYSFVIYVAPVGKYFSGPGAKMLIEASHQRAAPKGVGDVKTPGNYAPCFSAQKEARDEGYSDIVYLDVTGKYIEEVAASNFFVLGKDGVLRTPTLGTILPGVTRNTMLQLAKRLAEGGEGPIKGVEECQVSLEQVRSATEAFATGTAAGCTPILSVTMPGGETVEFPSPGPAAKLLQETFRSILLENAPDDFNWLWDPTEAASSKL